MGQLLPETRESSQRGGGHEKADGGDAEFHEYAWRDASNAWYACVVRYTRWNAPDAGDGGDTSRGAANVADDDITGHGPDTSQSRDDDADDERSGRR